MSTASIKNKIASSIFGAHRPFFLAQENIHSCLLTYQKKEIKLNDFELSQISLPNNYKEMSNKRLCEFLAGRISAKCAINQLDHNMSHHVGYLPDRSPNWPNGTLGSITHTDSVVASCVANTKHYRNIGIDIEEILSHEQCSEIRTYVLTNMEAEYDLHNINMTLEAYTTLLFSAKESIYKALYKDVGRFFDFETVQLIDLQTDRLHFRLMGNLSNLWRAGTKITVNYAFIDSNVYTAVFIKNGQ